MRNDKDTTSGKGSNQRSSSGNDTSIKRHEKRKQKGRRRDAYRVHLPYDLNALFPYLMKRRSDSVIYFSESIVVENILTYVKEQKGTEDEVSFFQILLLSAIKLLRERPELNRYVKGRRLYQRENVVVNFIAKREFSDSASETNVTLRIKPEDTYETILGKIRRGIKTAKAGEEKDDDKLISALMRLPRCMLLALFKILDLMDFYKGIPKDMERVDPIRCSIFVANLGSVGIDAPYHHLFEWGTNSLFVTIGRIKKMPVVEEDGAIAAKTVVDIKVSLDDRISDGFYCARSLDLFKQFLQHPEELRHL